jgi:hypothetical protein
VSSSQEQLAPAGTHSAPVSTGRHAFSTTRTYSARFRTYSAVNLARLVRTTKKPLILTPKPLLNRFYRNFQEPGVFATGTVSQIKRQETRVRKKDNWIFCRRKAWHFLFTGTSNGGAIRSQDVRKKGLAFSFYRYEHLPQERPGIFFLQVRLNAITNHKTRVRKKEDSLVSSTVASRDGFFRRLDFFDGTRTRTCTSESKNEPSRNSVHD